MAPGGAIGGMSNNGAIRVCAGGPVRRRRHGRRPATGRTDRSVATIRRRLPDRLQGRGRSDVPRFREGRAKPGPRRDQALRGRYRVRLRHRAAERGRRGVPDVVSVVGRRIRIPHPVCHQPRRDPVDQARSRPRQRERLDVEQHPVSPDQRGPHAAGDSHTVGVGPPTAIQDDQLRLRPHAARPYHQRLLGRVFGGRYSLDLAGRAGQPRAARPGRCRQFRLGRSRRMVCGIPEEVRHRSGLLSSLCRLFGDVRVRDLADLSAGAHAGRVRRSVGDAGRAADGVLRAERVRIRIDVHRIPVGLPDHRRQQRRTDLHRAGDQP